MGACGGGGLAFCKLPYLNINSNINLNLNSYLNLNLYLYFTIYCHAQIYFAMSEIDILRAGERYLHDPTTAEDLVRALVAHWDPAHLIDQAWLNCHWDHPDAIELLVDVSDIYGLAPEPLQEFLHVCWARNELKWHHFLTLDLLEDKPGLAGQIYSRFVDEGPSDEVVDSMMFLQGSLDSDDYAKEIMPYMINRGMLSNPCTGLLKLWRRYGVCEGIEEPALIALRYKLCNPKLANYAIRVIECLKFRDICPMLDCIVKLACYGPALEIATRRARRVIVEVSTGRYCKHVARAICAEANGWYPWMTRLHHACQWRLLDYMRDHRAIEPMIDLMNTFPSSALRHGVFTRIMQMDPDYFERADINDMSPETFPISVHSAVHYMYMRGQPPPAIAFFYAALDMFPDAVGCIAQRAPLVRCEVTWARRKLLLCAMAAANSTRPVKSVHCIGGTADVLKVLTAHECIWPSVLQFL